ncbi:MAG TPA: hypothetical protein VG345_01550 [Bryobacteraceae bacterium]|jgi:Arc/MetJ-type ribon-helix-helix transcriptional regulator|nr:hypothetical protein [Bryobacteraceae bacterium]
MSIELKPEHQRVIDMAVMSGAYHDAEEVLDQAIAIISEQLQLQDWMQADRECIATQVSIGFMQAESGDLIDEDIAVEMLRSRRAERLKTPG